MQATVDTWATPRVERLRERALEHAHGWATPREAEVYAARSWLGSGGEGSLILRRGLLAGDILRGLTPVIDDDELLAGKYCRRPLTAAEEEEIDHWRQFGQPSMPKAFGQRAHMAIDYALLLREGVAGIRAQIERYRGRLDLARTGDLEKDDFYRACLYALDGLTALSRKYAELADERAETAAADRQAELREIARICGKVPESPAETFHEAMQAVHFVTFCQCAGNQMALFQLGRPDRYLLPYYRRDMAEGRLTHERAQELIDCLGILLNEYTPRGLAVGLMVGGRDENGVDITNELTYLFVRSVGHVRLAYPGVGLCWNAGTPRELTELACDLLARGYSHPALFNDEVITRGMLHLGLPHRDACHYIHSTCVEITPIAISNVYVASPYYNLVQCLHDVLGISPLDEPGKKTLQGIEPGSGITPLAGRSEQTAIESFDDLLQRYRARLSELISEGVLAENRNMMSRAQNGGFPLLSPFVNDCLARGRDIDHGGARANWIESSFVGLANLADALAAIRQTVFEDRSLTLERLREALLADFAGYDDVRALLARAPKYGNDDDRVDGLVGWITRMLREECVKHHSYWDGPVVPGLFCWIVHEHYGRLTRASADGRPAGFPFADGSGPAQGRERLGPTAAIRSVTKWDHSPMLGGIAVNLRFHPDEPDRLAAPMRHVLETFLHLGGFEVQVNVVGAEILRDAQTHPEHYRDLVVRVAGYSDYFVGLPPNMQKEVIARTELEL